MLIHADIIELSGMSVENYKYGSHLLEFVLSDLSSRSWFVDTCQLILSKLKPEACAIFYQSDIKVVEKDSPVSQEWLDKSFLCRICCSCSVILLLLHFTRSSCSTCFTCKNWQRCAPMHGCCGTK